MKINWKVRLKNPVFWAQVAVALLSPILVSLGLQWEDMTTWPALGDVMVLLSDGVTACGQEWLEDLVLQWDEEENPNLLAQRITDEARRRRSDGHEDDITALVLVLK